MENLETLYLTKVTSKNFKNFLANRVNETGE